jgi:hypothetical protein
MNTPLLTDRIPSDNPVPAPSVEPGTPSDSGRVSRRMLRERAVEVARIAGRASHETNNEDWEEAKSHFNSSRMP